MMSALLELLKNTFNRVNVTIRFSSTGYLNMDRLYKYFTNEEVEGLDTELVSKLDSARRIAGVAFVITSGLRSPESNERAMGVEHSTHLRGLAVDLRADCSEDRFLIVDALLKSGFKRIGVYTSHVHADISPEPAPVMWVGLSH